MSSSQGGFSYFDQPYKPRKLDFRFIDEEIAWLAKNHGVRTSGSEEVNDYELRIGDRMVISAREERGELTDRMAEVVRGRNKDIFYWNSNIGRLTQAKIGNPKDPRLLVLQEKLSQGWFEFEWKWYRQYDYEPIEEMMGRTRIYKPKINKKTLIRGRQLLLKFKK